MKIVFVLGMVLMGSITAMVSALQTSEPTVPVPQALQVPVNLNAGPENPSIDMTGFLQVAKTAAEHRASRRLTEEQFIKKSQEKGVIVLDARSKEKFDLLHIDGAINLSFPEISIDSLKRVLPNKDAVILIYCNNNFEGDKVAFAPKRMTASLNLSTYISLYDYGYRNIYELGPKLDVQKTKLKLVPTPKPAATPATTK
ncbi:MAG: rhodanese-like domain-containing protein [Fimbriiglobus sp.]